MILLNKMFVKHAEKAFLSRTELFSSIGQHKKWQRAIAAFGSLLSTYAKHVHRFTKNPGKLYR